MSFVDTLKDMTTTLEANTGLLALCNTQFEKPHTVKRVYKQRVEVDLSALPLIMITRPVLKPGRWRPTERDYTHTVRLYCGFQCDDRELAQELLIEFEEALDAAILVYKDPNKLFDGYHRRRPPGRRQ